MISILRQCICRRSTDTVTTDIPAIVCSNVITSYSSIAPATACRIMSASRDITRSSLLTSATGSYSPPIAISNAKHRRRQHNHRVCWSDSAVRDEVASLAHGQARTAIIHDHAIRCEIIAADAAVCQRYDDDPIPIIITTGI